MVSRTWCPASVYARRNGLEKEKADELVHGWVDGLEEGRVDEWDDGRRE